MKFPAEIPFSEPDIFKISRDPKFWASHIKFPFGNNSGLGLSICKQIVKTHGGSIIAGNKENGGAIFTVTFPLVNR